jgi:hypothetical protein
VEGDPGALKVHLKSVFRFVLVGLALLALAASEAGRALLHLARAHLWSLGRHANHPREGCAVAEDRLFTES